MNGPGLHSPYSDWLRAGRSEIESRWGRDFPPVQTGPGAHLASCTMDTGVFPGIEVAEAWGVGLTPHPHLVPKILENSRAIPLLTLRARVAYKNGENLHVLKTIRKEALRTEFFPFWQQNFDVQQTACLSLLLNTHHELHINYDWCVICDECSKLMCNLWWVFKIDV